MKNKYNLADTVFQVFLILWLVASIRFGWVGDGETFPRLGATLIAIVGIHLAFVPELNLNPHGYVESQKITSLRVNLNSRSIQDGREYTGELAAFLVKFLQEQNITPPTSIRNLAKLASDEARKRSSEIDWEDFNIRGTENAAQMDAADNQARTVKVSNIRAAAVWIAIGTLQWGFGDLVSRFAL